MNVKFLDKNNSWIFNMNSGKTESISTLSEHEDNLDEFEGSIVWSQEEPLSSNEILELAPDADKQNRLSLCRLCAGETLHPIYIYSEFGESLRLLHKINTCLSIKVIIHWIFLFFVKSCTNFTYLFIYYYIHQSSFIIIYIWIFKFIMYATELNW